MGPGGTYQVIPRPTNAGICSSECSATLPSARPGTSIYSNVGYALAGLMAEQVTGHSWEDLMRKRVFEPLGMLSAGFGPPGHAGRVDQPWGHQPIGKRGAADPQR